MNVWLPGRRFSKRAFLCAFSHVAAEPIWHPGCSLTSRPATGGVRGDPFARDCPQNPHRRHACGPVPPGRAAGVRVGADAEQAAPRGRRSSGCALRAGPRACRPGVGARCTGGVAARGDVRSPSVLDVSTRAPWHRHRRLGRRRRPAMAGRARDTPCDARSVILGRHAPPDLDRSPSRLRRRHGCPPARLRIRQQASRTRGRRAGPMRPGRQTNGERHVKTSRILALPCAGRACRRRHRQHARRRLRPGRSRTCDQPG